MKLESLKERLVTYLNESKEPEDFKDAISDGIYSCQFETETALNQWIKTWSKHIVEITKCEKEYQRGVRFVGELWEDLKISQVPRD